MFRGRVGEGPTHRSTNITIHGLSCERGKFYFQFQRSRTFRGKEISRKIASPVPVETPATLSPLSRAPEEKRGGEKERISRYAAQVWPVSKESSIYQRLPRVDERVRLDGIAAQVEHQPFSLGVGHDSLSLLLLPAHRGSSLIITGVINGRELMDSAGELSNPES